MRIIADILTDHKFLGVLVEGDPDEEARIIEIDNQEGINIFMHDKKNTMITIAEEDLNKIGYYKREL